MGQFVSPKVFLLGYAVIDMGGLEDYLRYTGQLDFLETVEEAREAGLSDSEILCSLYAKLCYKSLVLGKNANITRTRDIQDNVKGCFNTGHGSVFEHVNLNFVVTDCSRVFTHEQVRHRVGVAYSQTSGRYCRLDKIDLVWDPLLDPVKDLWMDHLGATEDLIYLTECKLGLRKPNPANPALPAEAGCCGMPRNTTAILAFNDAVYATSLDDRRWIPDPAFDLERRKMVTSAIRRIAPNGQANEIGMSLNIRSLRQIVQVRTARFAEQEIRDVYWQIYCLVKAKFPLIFHQAKERMTNGAMEVYGMKMQPFEIEAGDPKALQYWETSALQAELASRHAGMV